MIQEKKIELNNLLNQVILNLLLDNPLDDSLVESKKYFEEENIKSLVGQIFNFLIKIINSSEYILSESALLQLLNQIDQKIIGINKENYFQLLSLLLNKKTIFEDDYYEKMKMCVFENKLDNAYLEKIFLKEVLDYYILNNNYEEAKIISKILFNKIEESAKIEKYIYIF